MGTIYGETYPNSSISLAKYADIIQYRDCAFFGVSQADNERFACREIWTKAQRDDVADALAEAEDEIMREVGFPLTPRWYAAEKHGYACPVISKWGHVIAPGIMSETDLALGVAVNHAADPAEVTFASTLTEFDGLKIFYPDTDQEIIPSDITGDGVNVTIEIPRCRLVRYDLQDNPDEGLLYTTIANFQTTVDVKWYENDTTTQGTLIWLHDCRGYCTEVCSPYRMTACMSVHDHEIGIIETTPAVYSGGTWTKSSAGNCCVNDPITMEINYYAGDLVLDRTAQMAIVRLAHSKMPTEPCGCDVTQRLWKRDRHIPEVLTKERLNCQFGLSDGAWTAWKFAQSIALVKGGSL